MQNETGVGAYDLSDVELLKLKCSAPHIATVCTELESTTGNLLEDFNLATDSFTFALFTNKCHLLIK